ncbi:MAG: FAD-dependent oxidoreductase, partial [Devosiaceae bacterium]|nr:FAD-dependent oxidoreductase [Devosiaceae bacterium]
MAHVVVLGAGLGGAIMAYEMKEQLRPQDTITVVTKDPKYHFVPSNPWVAVNWRSRDDVEIDLAPVMERLGINFIVSPCQSIDPANNTMVLENGEEITYDFLIIATGPELAFDEIEGLGPEGNTHSICHVEHAVQAGKAFDEFCKNPGPI